jgi:DNA-binding transcriptional LysR family regulator
MGVSVAPLLTVEPGDESVVAIDLAGRMPPRIIGLAWHRDRTLSPAANAFVESAAAVCEKLSAEAPPALRSA